MCAPCKIILDCNGALATSAAALEASVIATAAGLNFGLGNRAFTDDQVRRILEYSDHICEMAKELDDYRADILKFGRELAMESQKAGRTGISKEGH